MAKLAPIFFLLLLGIAVVELAAGVSTNGRVTIKVNRNRNEPARAAQVDEEADDEDDEPEVEAEVNAAGVKVTVKANVCKRDEKFYECPPSCKNTCANYSNPGVRCGCAPPGCFCKEGLVKNGNKCIKPENCPRRA